MKRNRGHLKKASVPPPLPPPGIDPRHFGGGRDSDASFASSRPSSTGVARSSAAADLINDRSYQQSAIRAINAYLASFDFPPVKLKVPSAKEINSIFNFILSQLDIPDAKMEEDLPLVLKMFNCPFKVTKSALHTPATPHAWPTLVAILHWLVQIALCHDRAVPCSSFFNEETSMQKSLLEGYLLFIQGDDESVEAVEKDFIAKLNEEKDHAAAKLKDLEGVAAELEAKVEALRTGPSERELLENQKAVLEEDMKKFNAIIEDVTERAKGIEKEVEEKEKRLMAKAEEEKKICEENEELRKTLQVQTVNPRAVERMKREIHSLESDIADSETKRNNYEDKCWDLDSELGQKLKELEELVLECNKAIRKLKLGSDFQYVLDPKGRTPAEVIGIDYKSTVKPVLDSLADNINQSSMVKVEELIALQQQSAEASTKIDEKQNRIPPLNSRIEELEEELSFVKAETGEYLHRCALEANQMVDDIDEETQTLALLEEQAVEVLKTSEVKLQETEKTEDEELQNCANELLLLVDSISKHKEYMEAKVSEMMNAVSDAANAMAEARMNRIAQRLKSVYTS